MSHIEAGKTAIPYTSVRPGNPDLRPLEFQKIFVIRARLRDEFTASFSNLYHLGGIGKTDWRVVENQWRDERTREVQRIVQTGEAVDASVAWIKVNQDPRFGIKDLKTIRDEERARAYSISLTRALEKDYFPSAGIIIGDAFKSAGDDQYALDLLKQSIYPVIDEKLKELIDSDKPREFADAFLQLNDDYALDGNSLPVLSAAKEEASKVYEAIHTDLYSKMQLTLAEYAKARDIWTKSGVYSAEELNRSPQIHNYITKRLTEAMQLSLLNFEVERNAIDKYGIMAAEEANTLPQIIEIAKQYLIDAMEISDLNFEVTRNELVKLGVITIEEANELPQVKSIASKRLKEATDLGRLNRYVELRYLRRLKVKPQRT